MWTYDMSQHDLMAMGNITLDDDSVGAGMVDMLPSLEYRPSGGMSLFKRPQ